MKKTFRENSKRLILALLVMPLVCTAVWSQSVVVIRDVMLIDMRSEGVQPRMTVVVENNRISRIGRLLRAPKNATIIDGRGKYLIPGLWDMHVHIFNNTQQAGTDNHEIYFPLLIANGVTGVRDMWTDAEDQILVRQWNADMLAGKMLAPRIAPGSHIIDGSPTHMPNMLGVSTPDEARRVVRDQKAAGAGFIKVYWRLLPDVYSAIADESKKLKIPFAGHVPFAVSAFQASDAGQKSIEHLTGLLETCSSKEDELRNAKNLTAPELNEQLWRTYDEQKCRRLYARFAQNKTWQVPTTVLHRMLAFRREEDFRKDERLKYIAPGESKEWLAPPPPQRFSLEIRKQRYQKLLETIGTMYKTGVPILAGTDLGNPFIFAGFSLHDELELFVRAGLTPFQSLQTATVNPAIYLGRQKELGTIKKGNLADLILLDRNPLEDIGNTRSIVAVFANGRYLSRRDLDGMLADAEKIALSK